MKHIIWQSSIDPEDYEEILKEEFPNITDEAEKYRLCSILDSEYLDEEKEALSVVTFDHPILCIADIGRWNGRFPAWRFIGDEHKGADLSDIFSFHEGENQEFFVEDGELRCYDAHHDATNIYVYRAFICDPDDAWPLLDGIANGKDYAHLLDKYTRSLAKDVCEIHGWETTK